MNCKAFGASFLYWVDFNIESTNYDVFLDKYNVDSWFEDDFACKPENFPGSYWLYLERKCDVILDTT